MSWADVQGDAPPSEQPQPDLAFLDPPSGPTGLPASDHKVTAVPTDYKELPKGSTDPISDEFVDQEESDEEPQNATGSATHHVRKEKAREAAEDAEGHKGLCAQAKSYLLRPAVASGLLGIVNIGLLSTIGYQLYSRPGLRQDARFLSASAIGGLALFGAEGYAAEVYCRTGAGANEGRRACEGGTAIFKRTKEIVLRPRVLRGLVGVFNVGVLSGVGYWSYVNWDRPASWRRREISATVIALLVLFAGEGCLGGVCKKSDAHSRE